MMTDKPNGTNRTSRFWTNFIFFGVMVLALLIVAYQTTSHFREYTFEGVVTEPLVEVSAKTEGKVSRIYVSINQSVSKGQILGELYDDVLEEQILAASSEVQSLSINLDRIKSSNRLTPEQFGIEKDIKAAESVIVQIDLDIENSKKDITSASKELKLIKDRYERTRRLYDQKAITIGEVEQRWSSLIEAERSMQLLLNSLKEKQLQRDIKVQDIELLKVRKEELVNSLQREITEIEGQLRKAQGELNTFLARRNEMRLISPADGIISEVLKSIGEVVPAGYPVFRLVTGEKLLVNCYVPRDQLGVIQVGDEVEILTDMTARIVLPGKATGRSPVLIDHPNQVQSPLSRIEKINVYTIEFVDLSLAKEQVIPGQTVVIRLRYGSK